MLILASTADLLQVITGQAGTINVHASWMDNASGAVTPGRTNTAITTAATTTVVASPAAATQRNVKTLHVANAGATAVDITIQHTDGTTVSQLHKVTVGGGVALQYIDEVGFTTGSAATAGGFAAANNLVINSATEVSQESGTTAIAGITAINRYTVDMFGVHVLGAVIITAQQVADAPAGYKYSLKISVTTADASVIATDKALIYTAIEGYRCARLGFGAANPQSVSLGFWCKAHRTGSYSVSIENFNVNRAYPVSFNVNTADTWEYKTVVFPGDTTGTWRADNAAGIYINWVLMAGTNFTGTANTWNAARTEAVTGTLNGVAAITDTFQICGVSLVPGTTPIGQGTIVSRNFDEELVLAQRYYEKSYNYAVAPATAPSFPGCMEWGITVSGGITVGEMTASQAQFTVWKRTSPVVTVYSPQTGAASKAYEEIGAVDTAISLGSLGERGTSIQAVGTTSNPYWGAQWTADARL